MTITNHPRRHHPKIFPTIRPTFSQALLTTLKLTASACKTREARSDSLNTVGYSPENEHDNGKNNDLKMYFLLKRAMFHCHVSFEGGIELFKKSFFPAGFSEIYIAIYCHWLFLIQCLSLFP